MSGRASGGIGTPRVRPAAARGRVAMPTSGTGAIDATEAFSRGDAIDRDWMGWGALRVLSRQDWAPGAARDEGRVANMERLLLVLDGVLDVECGRLGRHRVASGGALWIGAGHGTETRMANASGTRSLRLVECWLQPDRVNAAPAVAIRPVDVAAGIAVDGETRADAESAGEEKGAVADAWTTLAAGDVPGDDPDPGAPGEPVATSAVLPLRQRARAMSARVGAGDRLALPSVGAGRYWLEVLHGDAVAIDRDVPADDPAGGRAGRALAAGDGLCWLAGDSGAPQAVAAAGPGPAWLLLLALPA